MVTVAEAGWSGKKNVELLALAEKEFDVLVTTDKVIPHQQNVPKLDLVLVALLLKRATLTETSSRSWRSRYARSAWLTSAPSSGCRPRANRHEAERSVKKAPLTRVICLHSYDGLTCHATLSLALGSTLSVA